MSNLKKYLAYNNSVRVILFDGTDMVKELRRMHSLSNVATAALGRVSMVTAIIASTLKEEKDRLTVQIKCDGELGSIVVCGNTNLEIKGYVLNPQIELPLNSEGKLDVGQAIGVGTLTVIKDIGLKDPYIGTCELLSGEIGDDFAYYFNVSEQTPSVVAVGVLIGKDGEVKNAGGYIIQPLPECEDDIIDKLEKINLIIPQMTVLMSEDRTLDDIAVNITGDSDIKCIYDKEAIYKCDCSKERIENAIIALGEEEAFSVLRENNNIMELGCNFCNTKYRFSDEDIRKLFKE